MACFIHQSRSLLLSSDTSFVGVNKTNAMEERTIVCTCFQGEDPHLLQKAVKGAEFASALGVTFFVLNSSPLQVVSTALKVVAPPILELHCPG